MAGTLLGSVWYSNKLDHGSAFKPDRLGRGNDGIGRLLPDLGKGLESGEWPIHLLDNLHRSPLMRECCYERGLSLSRDQLGNDRDRDL